MVMRIAGLFAALACAACVDDRYRCTSDEQCDLGEAGRCERDQRCSYWDAACPTARRYAEHAGELTGTCVDDRVAPVNACADGQPPARPEGCFADVCSAIPACCETGWSSACVQQAQLRCPELRCDTRIAVTATTGAATELWDVRWDGAAWSATAAPEGELLAWLAPAAGTGEPRLAHAAAGVLTVGEATLALGDRVAQSVTSVDLDRTGRDHVAITAVGGGTQYVELANLETGAVTETRFASAAAASWGDYDHDGFPDLVVGNATTNRVAFLANTAAEDHTRTVAEAAVTDLFGDPTPGQTPQVRTLEWSDLTGDGLLDLVVGGNVVRVHQGGAVVRDVSLVTADCEPVATANHTTCSGEATFAATTVPTVDATAVWMASFPARELTTLALDPTQLTCVPLAACADCAPFVALVARDLDGDHAIDVVAIDQDLGVWTVRADGTATKVLTIPTTQSDFTRVRTSVSGAPTP